MEKNSIKLFAELAYTLFQENKNYIVAKVTRTKTVSAGAFIVKPNGSKN